jgi:hypothetical protein
MLSRGIPGRLVEKIPESVRYSIFRKGFSDATTLKPTQPKGAAAVHTVQPDPVFRKMP